MTTPLNRRQFFSFLVSQRKEEDSSLYAQENVTSWIERVAHFVDSTSEHQGSFLSLPDYRPDVAQSLAQKLDLIFYDFRNEYLSPLKWGAGKVELSELLSTLKQKSIEGPLLVFNTEALLTTKTECERSQWYAEYLETSFQNPVLSVMTLYTNEIKSENHLIFEREDIPDQTILKRMLELKDGTNVKKEHPVIRI